MNVKDRKESVTVSEITETTYGEEKLYHASMYVECSFCDSLEHLMKIDFCWERDKSDQLSFSSVDFSLPSSWYVKGPWYRVKRWPWRLFQIIGAFFRRLKLSLIVLAGGEIRLSPAIDLDLSAVRILGNKMSHLSSIAMREHGNKDR